MDGSGNLYGTADYDSGCGCGVIYKLAPGPKGRWKYTVLHTFRGSDGALPEGNLVLDDKGNLYGGTALGGTYGFGVVFQLTPQVGAAYTLSAHAARWRRIWRCCRATANFRSRSA